MKQKLEFDLTTKIISALVIAIPFVMIIAQYSVIKENNEILSLTSIFLFITYFVAWMLHPTSYEITNENLVIHRPVRAIKISLASIKNIERTEPGYSMRLFGSGGLFGYYGLFSSNKLGRHHRYTGNNKNLVLISTEKKKYLLSIHDDLFFQELSKKTNSKS
jgi:hypothetical protein